MFSLSLKWTCYTKGQSLVHVPYFKNMISYYLFWTFYPFVNGHDGGIKSLYIVNSRSCPGTFIIQRIATNLSCTLLRDMISILNLPLQMEGWNYTVFRISLPWHFIWKRIVTNLSCTLFGDIGDMMSIFWTAYCRWRDKIIVYLAFRFLDPSFLRKL